MATGSPWTLGQLGPRHGPWKVNFGRMYEDAAIEEAAFRPGSRIFCIASAGCTALALAGTRDVTAVDLNPAQLAYARTRAAGGPYQDGQAEERMALGRHLLPLVGWTQPRLEEFMALRATSDQLAYWSEHLDTRRFRAALAMLLSGPVLRFGYQTPLIRALPPAFDRVLRARMERCWRTHSNGSNPYARALLTGHAPAATRPTGRPIRFLCVEAAGFLERCPAGAFDGFALSNIHDGASAEFAARLDRAVRRAAAPDAIIVRRSFREPMPSPWPNRAPDDRAFIWGTVEVRPVEGQP